MIEVNFQEVETGLGNMFKLLSDRMHMSIPTLVMSEVGIILKTCAARTKVAKDEKIDLNTRLKVLRELELTGSGKFGRTDLSINAGLRGKEGRMWHYNAKTGRYQCVRSPGSPVGNVMKFHLKPGVWTDVQEATTDYTSALFSALPKNRASAGLARQSFVQMADDLGIDLSRVKGGQNLPAAALAKARKALASSGKPVRTGRAKLSVGPDQFFVTLIDSLRYAEKAKIDKMFYNTMNGRLKYFQANIRMGVFEDMQAVARKYPYCTARNSLLHD